MPPRKLKKLAEDASEFAPNARKGGPLSQGRALVDKAFAKEPTSWVAIDEESIKVSRPHIPTGSIVVDYVIGGKMNRFGVRPCPGLPRGNVINLYGQESSGKTTLALTIAAMVCQAGGTVCYIDWENAIDIAYAKALGVPLDDEDAFLLSQPESLEKGMAIMWTMAKAGVDLIVIDSVGAGVPKAQLGQAIAEKGDQGRIGLNASKWSTILPDLKGVINRTHSCVLGISQLRKKIGMTGYGEGADTQAQGGEAWKFYSEVRIALKRVAQEKGMEYNALTHKKEEAFVGQTVKIRIDKCKVSASQGKTAEFYIRFGEGVDDLRSVIEITSAHGIVKKGGAWYTFERDDGTSIRGQGMDDFKAKVREADGAWEELYRKAVGAFSKVTAVITDEVLEDDGLADFDAIMAEKPIITNDED